MDRGRGRGLPIQRANTLKDGPDAASVLAAELEIEVVLRGPGRLLRITDERPAQEDDPPQTVFHGQVLLIGGRKAPGGTGARVRG